MRRSDRVKHCCGECDECDPLDRLTVNLGLALFFWLGVALIVVVINALADFMERG